MGKVISAGKTSVIQCTCHLCGRTYICEGSIGEIEEAMNEDNWMPDGWVTLKQPHEMFYCEDCVRKCSINLLTTEDGIDKAFEIVNGFPPKAKNVVKMRKQPGVSIVCSNCGVRTVEQCTLEEMKKYLADDDWTPTEYWKIEKVFGKNRYTCDICNSNKNLRERNERRSSIIIMPPTRFGGK